MRRAPVLVVGAATALTLGLAIAPAQAHGGHKPPRPPAATTVADGLFTALSSAVARDGTAYVTQNFSGTLTKIPKRGARSDIYQATPPAGSEQPPEVGGVSVARSKVLFAETGFSGDPENPGGFTGIKSIDRRGTVKVVADTGAYEIANNPDGDVVYGARGISAECAAQWPAPDPETGEGPPPSTYTGDVNPHPYATLPGPFGTTFVADAGANSIQRISASGRITTLALMPGQPLKITAELAGAFGIPACAVGLSYYFDPVPTDVEWGPDGWLYVSLLPGGPEDPSLGARGAVYKVNPVSGRTVKVAGGFLGATNLAVTPKGDIYVAEIFGNQLSVLKRGSRTPKPFAPLPWATSVEYAGGSLYATSSPELEDLFAGRPPAPESTLVKYRLSQHRHRR
ncbi:ScyD/ScyE family protein [Mumia sp. ZJ1417]|uniref:ScyD/ScyE family protein n=1 Tax=unclassified Mumia TaxID=2621872 RepID=UPI00141FF8AF|nr:MULTISPECIES: ScyD/ScyE family protein [unclassified Mumia]QMW67136.1 ScyD/ScyE family protein [Mumia sp. ZJ1417]